MNARLLERALEKAVRRASAGRGLDPAATALAAGAAAALLVLIARFRR